MYVKRKLDLERKMGQISVTIDKDKLALLAVGEVAQFFCDHSDESSIVIGTFKDAQGNDAELRITTTNDVDGDPAPEHFDCLEVN